MSTHIFALVQLLHDFICRRHSLREETPCLYVLIIRFIICLEKGGWEYISMTDDVIANRRVKKIYNLKLIRFGFL